MHNNKHNDLIDIIIKMNNNDLIDIIIKNE